MSFGLYLKTSAIIILSMIVISCNQSATKEVTTQASQKNEHTKIETPNTIKSSPRSTRVTIEKITSAQFERDKQNASLNKPVEKITDFKIVQKVLEGIVIFEKLDGHLGIKKINFRNGITSDASYQLDECSFSTYFPEEDVLLLECGHTTDRSFDLKTGRDTYEVGNLNYITTSLTGKYRLNKIFEGQECFNHFIQMKEKGKYQKVLDLNEIFKKKTGKWLCVIEKEFWTDDHTLYFGLVTQYKEEGNEYEFYKIKIVN